MFHISNLCHELSFLSESKRALQKFATLNLKLIFQFFLYYLVYRLTSFKTKYSTNLQTFRVHLH